MKPIDDYKIKSCRQDVADEQSCKKNHDHRKKLQSVAIMNFEGKNGISEIGKYRGADESKGVGDKSQPGIRVNQICKGIMNQPVNQEMDCGIDNANSAESNKFSG